MSNNGQCGQHGTAERYLLGELDDTERQSFEAHYFECPSCGDEVKTAAAFLESAREALAGPRRDRAPPATRNRRWSGATAGLAAAATIALVLAGYQGLVQIPALRRDLAVRDRPTAIVATVLRPATRGTPPVVKAAADQPFIAVALEPPADGVPGFAVELLTETGAWSCRRGRWQRLARANPCNC
jgi:anti-sigma factor RsiW